MRDPRSLWVVLALLVVTLPWVEKPVHIDDTFVLEIADQILEAPWDPFGGTIDWFGHVTPVWRATTNPPVVSYWLALAVAVGGRDDVWLHLWMLPFYWLAGWGVWSLCRRFAKRPLLATLFFILSPAFVVSGNLMRDIPATAFACAGLALLVTGVDDHDARRLRRGAWLLGLAALTKYSFAVLWPAAVWYAVRRRSSRTWRDLVPLVVPLGVWCAYTWVLYGEPHPWYLLWERSASDLKWPDKWFSALSVLGTCLFLAPWAVVRWAAMRRYATCALVLVAAAAVAYWGHVYYAADWDWGFAIAVFSGALLFVAVLIRLGEEVAQLEAQFLGLWFLAVVGFSVFFVPFNAVRHLIVALLPVAVTLTGLELRRIWDRRAAGWIEGALFGLLLLGQGVVAWTVQAADFEYAAVYRDFAARYAAGELGAPGTSGRTWFVGHWGWQYYAERAGLRMLHRDGEKPAPGDWLVWPEKVHVGDALSGNPELRSRLVHRASVVYPGAVPWRTMSVEARAGFYAVIKRRIPYRWRPDVPLETFRVYEVAGEGSGSSR
ncbi:MAG: hypothetical protein Kow00109_08210 [Acidobacteriota bacterium]